MGKSIEEYTKEIEELKKKNDDTVDLLEKQAFNLLDKSVDFLKTRIKYEIELCVKANPAHTKELADQGKLKDMKESMNQLLVEIPNRTTLAMSEDKIFVHRTLHHKDINKNSTDYRYIIKNGYKEIYQTIVGLAGSILNKYGYIKVENDYNSHSQWQFISGSGGEIKYGHTFDMKQVEGDWEEYINTLITHYRSLMKYKSLIQQKQEVEAKDIWDNI